MIISACLIPFGSEIEEDGELREERGKRRVLLVFSTHIPADSSPS